MGKKDEIKASNPIAHYFQENMGILIALAGLCIFLEIMNQRFFTWSNWLTILDNVSKTGFLAIGITGVKLRKTFLNFAGPFIV